MLEEIEEDEERQEAKERMMSNISDIEKWPSTATNLLKAFKNQLTLHKLFSVLGEGELARLRVIGIPVRFLFISIHYLDYA